MTLSVSFDLKNARLSAVVAFLDTGESVARVRIYPGVRVLVGADPNGGFLAELPLQKPSGSVLDGLLTLVPGDPVLNANSGVAAWARLVNGNGETAFDCDVSDTTGTGEIKIQNTVLFEGGETRMVSGTLGG
jgi:hypothetical protein